MPCAWFHVVSQQTKGREINQDLVLRNSREIVVLQSSAQRTNRQLVETRAKR